MGGFRQLPSLRDTPFGRYLDDVEEGFTKARQAGADRARRCGSCRWPTARNLSLPHADFLAAGPFDERFRSTCEDQDLAIRARARGIRFLYDASIDCLHNDQAGDLVRCCRAQRRGTHDTVLFCAKHAAEHAGLAARARERAAGARGRAARDRAQGGEVAALARPGAGACWSAPCRWLERAGTPERALRRVYRGLIGLHTFRGWRDGLQTLARQERAP